MFCVHSEATPTTSNNNEKKTRTDTDRYGRSRKCLSRQPKHEVLQLILKVLLLLF